MKISNTTKTTATSSKSSAQQGYETLPDRILRAIRKVLPDPTKTYGLHEPEFSGNEWTYIKDCLDTRMVSSVGSYVNRFERMLEDYTKSKHAVAVVNGTAGLHIALQLAGVQSGEEVLVPALTFVATANAVTYCGADPHFVDSEESSLGIDPEKLKEYLHDQTEQRSGVCVSRKTGKVIRAILPMHTFGHPAHMEKLLKIAADFHIRLVEDAAESIGSLYQGKHTGTLGLLGVLSFNGNKMVTTGGGGAILTNNAELAAKAKHLTTTAKTPHLWEYRHDQIGYNYRMPNLNAALGCAQLEKAPHILKSKRKLFEMYEKVMADIDEVKMFQQPQNCRSNYWLQVLLINKKNQKYKTAVLEKLQREKILARPAWGPLHQQIPYRKSPKMDLETTESICNRLINLPSSAFLAPCNKS